MVIKANIASWEISIVLVDSGSSTDIIFVNAFDQMKLSKTQLQPLDSPLRLGTKPDTRTPTRNTSTQTQNTRNPKIRVQNRVQTLVTRFYIGKFGLEHPVPE
jgi:hypothetical protein